ncbi:MAG: hypothetical protein KA604_03190 [Candidatus Saccharimonas sp.]|nr:hypothetical protein [Candidatus Saccharimonas sp.]
MARPNQLILVANPGSSSRKYALYECDDLRLRGELHFETDHDKIICTLSTNDGPRTIDSGVTTVNQASRQVIELFQRESVMSPDDTIAAIGLRIVAPSAYFMQDHLVTDEVVAKLEEIEHLAPLHIAATLSELHLLRQTFADQPIVGVSDSAFHRTKPNYAWNYAINLRDADTHDIKRFGYHGISVGAAIDTLWNNGKLPPKVIVCHLGSGSSITGVFHGRSIDTTMGFTPNEGVVMATRSGSVSPDAARVLRDKLQLDDAGLENYLNSQSGLLGLGNSNDIRELIEREAVGDHDAHLALTTLIHSYHKSIGAMLVALNGCDALVFTGTVGERSSIIRKRIVAHLQFCDFILDGEANDACTQPQTMTLISQETASKPLFVIPTSEARQIAEHVIAFI